IAKKFSMGGKNRIRDRIVEMCYPVEVKGKSRREIDEKKFFKLLEI
ncbi:AAA family ATPase, partial [Fusobacterium mortiferum]|nr:AAA family ATPase [Fusobacterium mortiferum]MCF2629060.1 AAA family ATPase [Fusobacterium mortiferum]